VVRTTSSVVCSAIDAHLEEEPVRIDHYCAAMGRPHRAIATPQASAGGFSRRGDARVAPPVTGRESLLAVETAGLSKHFGTRQVVRGVDLHVPRGVAFGYLGPNGAGKTTLIRTLLGLTPASGGSMWLLGLPVPQRRAQALARVGAVVDEPRFHAHLSGRENLEVIAAAREPEASTRISSALERVGLANRACDRVKHYSLGMRQRLGIARCLLADPELLILDEPMNGLDPAAIREFRSFVRDFVAEGRTIVLSSHLLDEVEKTCDHVAIVDHGQIALQGAIDELRRDGGPQLLIEIDDPLRARAVLSGTRLVREIADGDGPLHVYVVDDCDVAAQLNGLLVKAGLAVRRLEPIQTTLEQRFLELTTRLEDAV
jgi:ABC-2 type transport system ATP-binding protein